MQKRSAKYGAGRAGGIVAAVACMAVGASAAVVAPFEDDFSTDPFTNANYYSAKQDITFEYRSAAQTIRAIGTPDKGNFSLVTEVSNLGSTFKTGFAVAVDVVNNTSDGNQMALYALVDGTNTTVNSALGYTANFNPGTGVRIYADGSLVTTTNWVGITTGAYALSLQGVYNELDELELTFTVTDGTVTQSVSYVALTPSEDQFFGIGGRVLSASGGRTIAYDNFSVKAIGEIEPPDPFNITGIDVSVDGGDTIVRVDFDSTGHAYTLQFKAQLPLSEWSNVVSGASSPLVYTNNAPSGFFRVGAQ